MKQSEISEFEIEEKDFKLRLSRKNGEPQVVQAAPISTAPALSTMPPATSLEPAGSAKPPAENTDTAVVKSPMVGTFYIASSPESPPFVKPGDKITTESIVCIIEAMKVMNEIHAETTGTISEILVENGDTVEYGQPLFKVKTT